MIVTACMLCAMLVLPQENTSPKASDTKFAVDKEKMANEISVATEQYTKLARSISFKSRHALRLRTRNTARSQRRLGPTVIAAYIS